MPRLVSGSAPNPPVIVIGAGISALGALRAFAGTDVQAYVADASDRLLLDSRFHHPVPNSQPLTADVRLADWLASLPLDRAVLMPCSDHRVCEVASLTGSLRARFASCVSSAPTLDAFVDKGQFANMLESAGMPHPRSWIVDGPADFHVVPDSAFESAILKPRDSQSFVRLYGVKAFHVSSRDDAIEQVAQLQKTGSAVILQEYVPGPASEHYFVDGFIDQQGVVKATFVRRRLRMFPLDFGNSTAMVSVDPSEAAGAVSSLAALLARVNYRGIFSAEFKRDVRDGVFRLLEVNTRVWWYVDFATRSGVDVCRMAYDDALNRPVSTVTRYAVGRRLVFPYYDYFACRELRRQGKLSLGGWLGSWTGAMQPIFQSRDPMPSLRGAAKTVRGFARNRLSRMFGARHVPEQR